MTMSSRRLINSGRKWPLIRAMMASRTESGILGEHEHSAVGSSLSSSSSSSEEGALGSPTRFFIFLVGGEAGEGVGKIDRSPLPVGQPPVVEDLEEDVEDVWVGLFHLVKEDHRVPSPPDGLGQDSALVVADIPGGGTDEPCHRVLFSILGAVDADDVRLVLEKEPGQSLAELGLARPCGPGKQERPPMDGMCYGTHSMRLPDHTRVEKS